MVRVALEMRVEAGVVAPETGACRLKRLRRRKR